MKYKYVLLYFRQPYTETFLEGKKVFQLTEKPNGVLQTLKSFFLAHKDSVWIASGTLIDNQPLFRKSRIVVEDFPDGFNLREVMMTSWETEQFYHRTCKEAFWPILHSFTEKFQCESLNWEIFCKINKRFADAACMEADEDSIIWIHDYNLWLAPYYIKQMMPSAKIAFFSHTTFPAADIFTLIPQHRKIIQSLLLCDFIGFDIPRYVENFVNTAHACCTIKITKRQNLTKHAFSQGLPLSEPVLTKRILYEGRQIELNAVPEGTDFKYISNLSASASVSALVEEKSKEVNGRKVIFSASRSDYIKGGLEMLKSYECLLDKNLIAVRETVLSLLSVSPGKIGAYGLYQREIEQAVHRINEKYTENGLAAIIYSDVPLRTDEMIAWYKIANILWVPSLRDGMNIICKEFVVVKDGKEGVLVLSKFAGASIELHQAILTNPFSIDDMTKSILIGLEMSPEEQKTRMESMLSTVKKADIFKWINQLKILENNNLKNKALPWHSKKRTTRAEDTVSSEKLRAVS